MSELTEIRPYHFLIFHLFRNLFPSAEVISKQYLKLQKTLRWLFQLLCFQIKLNGPSFKPCNSFSVIRRISVTDSICEGTSSTSISTSDNLSFRPPSLVVLYHSLRIPGDTHHDVTVHQGFPPPPLSPPPSVSHPASFPSIISRCPLHPSVSISLVGNNKWTDSISSRTPSQTPSSWTFTCTKKTCLYFWDKKAVTLSTKLFLSHCTRQFPSQWDTLLSKDVDNFIEIGFDLFFPIQKWLWPVGLGILRTKLARTTNRRTPVRFTHLSAISSFPNTWSTFSRGSWPLHPIRFHDHHERRQAAMQLLGTF